MPDPNDVAESAGLVYFSDERPGIRREGRPGRFRYRTPAGEPLRDEPALERIHRLAIPPAWTGVWICPKANGHLQATGRDVRGRKQYRYHPQFREVSEAAKYEHMLEFARALPDIRATLAKHMALRGLPREKVLATVVHLLETTLIRVGNEDYARQNRSYGLTTLRNPHVQVEGAELRFNFKGKGGKSWRLQVRDRRVAKVVKACQDLPGQNLFEYMDEEGVPREITSADVNAYLREITGRDITAKDFRTWAGTVLAALALREFDAAGSEAAAARNVRAAVARVASRLGNTPAICRKCYIHPEIVSAYTEGGLVLAIRARAREGGLTREEAAVLALLEKRLAA
jgi:DNA topoisomerase I